MDCEKHYTMYTDTNTLCSTVLVLLKNTHAHNAVKTSRWTNREMAASGVLRPFREMSDFIPSFKLSAATHPTWPHH